MTSNFNEEDVLHKLKHFLPAQAPLKDFVHHNTLHAFQELNFYDATRQSAVIFGTRTFLSLEEFRDKNEAGLIRDEILTSIITEKYPNEIGEWRSKLQLVEEPLNIDVRIGRLRALWQSDYAVDMDGMVRPKIIRLINAYLDQGIAFKPFPEAKSGLLNAIEYIQENSYLKLFRSKRAIHFLEKEEKSLAELLKLIVGDERYYEQYLFDQQFSHPGISGMVCAIERKNDSLYAERPIKLFELIYLELLFELESLESFVNENFKPLAIGINIEPVDLFEHEPTNDYWKVLEIWQEAFEKSYHDQVLTGLQNSEANISSAVKCQAFFCIDDREESIRRNIELVFEECETYGTPAHFSIEAKFKPFGAKFATQICPGPIKPSFLIKEKDRTESQKSDIHFKRGTHTFFSGFLVSQTVGFWSSLKLLINIFNPQETASQYNAISDHMDYHSDLIYINESGEKEDGLQIGYKLEEMMQLVFDELTNTGLTANFAPLVYMFGHGGSSTNNPYFAGYNCGACSGRPSTLNARLFALIANRKDVRSGLKLKGMNIPETTHFVGGYHDTTQDTFAYFDEQAIPKALSQQHEENTRKFEKALNMNAKERARQFQTINIKSSAEKVHKKVIDRSRALFEPRPEYNHSNNCLFIIGRRSISQKLFLDQRAFLNSYDYRIDPTGNSLRNILNAGTGVCGGINLEYFFSSTDNEKLGAGSKLPQNIFGLYGVANGVKGDLRPGLPWQMIDVHDPIRILTVVEHRRNVVMEALESNPATLEWYANDWMKLAVIDPETKELFMFKKGAFVPYNPLSDNLEVLDDLEPLLESTHENLPVYQLK